MHLQQKGPPEVLLKAAGRGPEDGQGSGVRGGWAVGEPGHSDPPTPQAQTDVQAWVQQPQETLGSAAFACRLPWGLVLVGVPEAAADRHYSLSSDSPALGRTVLWVGLAGWRGDTGFLALGHTSPPAHCLGGRPWPLPQVHPEAGSVRAAL